MGQSASQQSAEQLLVRTRDQLWRRCEPAAISYDGLLQQVQQLNALCSSQLTNMSASITVQQPDPGRERLQFGVDASTAESPLLWRATVRIICACVSHAVDEVIATPSSSLDGRRLTLRQFCRVRDALTQQSHLLSSLPTASSADSCVGRLLGDLPADDDDVSCCICLERRQDVTLPCGHAYCAICIEQWSSGGHKTCPLCRQLTADDQWQLTEAPSADQVRDDVTASVMALARADDVTSYSDTLPNS